MFALVCSRGGKYWQYLMSMKNSASNPFVGQIGEAPSLREPPRIPG